MLPMYEGEPFTKKRSDSGVFEEPPSWWVNTQQQLSNTKVAAIVRDRHQWRGQCLRQFLELPAAA